MSDVQPAPSANPGRWLLRADVGWQDLVRYGPPTFAVYLRIPFQDEAQAAGQAGEPDTLRRALETLARHTTTPSVAYAAIWEGWGGPDPAPDAPRIPIPHRTMLLFTGPVDALRYAPALAWGMAESTYAEPHLVWPEDRAWCVACDVDEEVEFTVACTDDAAQALAEALPVTVRRVNHGDPAPLHRNPEWNGPGGRRRTR